MSTTVNTLHQRGHFWHTGFACMLLTAIGCGGDGPKLVFVKGTVTVNGSEPFANGAIRFTPKSPGNLTGSFAKTDDEGKYVLMHQSQRRGIVPGEYNVSFSLLKLRDGSPLPEADPTAAEEENIPAEKKPVEFVPAEYSSFGSTKNTTTVSTAGGTFDFDIPKLKTVEEATAAPAPPLGGGSRRRRDN